MIAKDDVCGYVGYSGAFERMLSIPVVADRMVRTARQRLATYIGPIAISAGDGAALSLRPVLPGDAERSKSDGACARETLHPWRYQGECSDRGTVGVPVRG